MTFYKNKNLLKLAIILSVFFGFFLGFNNGNVNAISDVSYTVNKDNRTSNHVLCSECSSDFNYIIIQPTSFPLSTFNSLGYILHLNLSSKFNYNVPLGINNYIVLDFSDEFPSSVEYIYESISNPFYQNLNGSVIITLSEKSPYENVPTETLEISENGNYNVINYSSISVNVPQDVTEIIDDPISNDFQKVFFAIVEKIIPAFGILLVVWFGIDMLSSLIFGRGR